jgi:hypothetical protein
LTTFGFHAVTRSRSNPEIASTRRESTEKMKTISGSTRWSPEGGLEIANFQTPFRANPEIEKQCKIATIPHQLSDCRVGNRLIT